jgi:hypothetical protein
LPCEQGWGDADDLFFHVHIGTVIGEDLKGSLGGEEDTDLLEQVEGSLL